MKHIKYILALFIVSLLLANPCISENTAPLPYIIRQQNTDFLTFEELQSLSINPNSDENITVKYNNFLRTPIIDNTAYYNGIKPMKPVNINLNTPIIRLASWNIEKSIFLDDAIIAFTSEDKFKKLINTKKVYPYSIDYQTIIRQRERLRTADIIVLQEMEVGVKRSGYIDASRELAKALNMNYVFAPQYLEVDPVLLGLEKIFFYEGDIDKEATSYFNVDPEKYKGVFGSAVLSRYPIKYVEVFPLTNQAYDWYNNEKKKTSFLEVSRRIGSKMVFKNEMTREVKVGGRHFFRVDLHVPGIPDETLTIINVHLEIKCLPKERERQISEILTYIKNIENPVILVGDFNSATTDLSPTSLKRTVKRTLTNPTTWFSAAVSYLSPNGLIINSLRGVSNVTKNYDNPLASHIPILAPNALKELFTIIYDFRFSDGGKFDFRGDANRSMFGKEGTLSNSNQRDFKGFKTTFNLKRPLGPVIGKYRLDWIFVKSYLTDSSQTQYRYRLAPHFGETLEELNTNLYKPISDHHPNVVDLPLNEPSISSLN